MSQVIVRAKHLEGPEVFFWEHNCRDQLRAGGKDPKSVKGGMVEEHVNAEWKVYASTSKPFRGAKTEPAIPRDSAGASPGAYSQHPRTPSRQAHRCSESRSSERC